MRAMILAAGEGKRLRPFTESIPKCLISIGGVKILQYWIDELALAGCGPFLVNSHYLSEQVKDFIETSRHKGVVTLVCEEQLYGTAGTFCNEADFFSGEDGILMHADNYAHLNFADIITSFKNRPKCCEILAVTHSTKTPESCGIFQVDKNGIVQAIFEKESGNNGSLANSAIFILSAKAIEEIVHNYGDMVDFSKDILPKFLGRIGTYHHHEAFFDIGTPEAMKAANLYAQQHAKTQDGDETK